MGLLAFILKVAKVLGRKTLVSLLFNLAADNLTKMIHKAQENGLFKGLAAEYIPQGVVVLKYADDTILCLQD
jgi:hypothetical protein